MVTPHDTAIVAAFFMDGLAVKKLESVNKAWDSGFYELVYEITRYAEFCWTLADVGGNATGDFPGVFDYEVSTPFGTWFGEWILAHNGSPPDAKDCREWLIRQTLTFFKQSQSVDEAGLLNVLEAVEFKLPN
jgi:hypothetical protein